MTPVRLTVTSGTRIIALMSLAGCAGTEKAVSESGDSGENCAALAWYRDVDGDGFGEGSSAVLGRCVAPDGYVADGEDCADADVSVYPGAPEVCLDGVPNDCLDTSGEAAVLACPAEGPYNLGAAEVKLLGGTEADHMGSAGAFVSGAGDTNGDGFDDLLVSTDGDVKAALALGPVSGRMSLTEAHARVVGYDGPRTWPAGDMDQDGYADLVAGEADNARGAWVLEGPLEGELDVSTLTPDLYSDYFWTEDGGGYRDVSDYAGMEVRAPGDLNGDGWGDVVVGAYRYSGEFSESTEGWCAYESIETAVGYEVGAAYVAYGPMSGTRSLAEAEGLLIGEHTGDWAGRTLASVGDLDGDGLADVFVAAGHQCEGGSEAGAAYVVLGPASGTRSLADADMKLMGGTGDGYEMVIAGAGDTNGDGFPDLLVGNMENSVEDSDAGRAGLVLGPPGEDRQLGEADAQWVGCSKGGVGKSLASAGDMDLDGLADVLIGASNYDNEEASHSGEWYRGAVALSYGPLEGTLSYPTLNTVFRGPNSHDNAGGSVSGAGDVDADGLADLLIGARYDDEVEDDAGAAYLIYGSSPFLSGEYGP